MELAADFLDCLMFSLKGGMYCAVIWVSFVLLKNGIDTW